MAGPVQRVWGSTLALAGPWMGTVCTVKVSCIPPSPRLLAPAASFFPLAPFFFILLRFPSCLNSKVVLLHRYVLYVAQLTHRDGLEQHWPPNWALDPDFQATDQALLSNFPASASSAPSNSFFPSPSPSLNFTHSFLFSHHLDRRRLAFPAPLYFSPPSPLTACH